MSFLSPALLFGLFAALIPPLIHLILRRRAVTVRFPALEFIQRANRKTARRFRVKQILLMLTRSALLGVLAFALARPFLQRATDPTALAGDAGGATVVVIDATYPMGYVLDGESLLDRARFRAEELLGDGAGLAALVVAGDEVAVPVGELTGELAAVRRPLGSLSVGHRLGTLPEAVARGYELLADAPTGVSRRVVVLTTPAGAASALPPPPTANGSAAIELAALDVSGGAPLPNRAVTGVELQPAPEMGADTWRVDARVGNFANEAVERLPIHLEVDGVVRVRGFLTLAPGEEAIKTFYAPFAGDAAAPASVVIEGDGLAVDDRRDFWLQPAPRVRVLAVNGDPQPTPYRDELFYLERALSPGASGAARVRLTVTAPDTLDRHALDDFDVVILANFASPTPTQARALSTFVHGGGGLWLTMGDQVDPGVANARLADLLPRALRTPRDAGDAAASAEGGDRQLARITEFDRAHPILRAVDDPAGSSLAAARIRRYMLLDPAPEGGGEVVLALDDGAPFLLTRIVDDGRVALMTGSVDRDWGDLPIRADFLPLVQQILRYLTRISEVDTAPVLVGHPAPMPVDDARVQRVEVRSPDGDLRVVERPHEAGAAWVFAETALPGHYRVAPDPPLPGLAALPGFAVAPDPAGADLRGAARPAGEEPTPDERTAALSVSRRTELWHAALLGLFLLLLGEGLLLFKRRGEAPALRPRRG
ncbi:MAG: BatA domain-containing protein, partial [Myxococcales bacterium]|nr:BatA domain-containing protein [Myxococcales bacterium]